MLTLVTTTIGVILVSLLLLIRKYYTFWKKYDIPQLKAKFPFGNIESLVKRERSFGTAIYDIYKNSTDSLLGIYLFFKPALLIRDPVLVKNILTSDFDSFHDRGVYVDSKNDPMSANLFALEGNDWKSLRTRLTPAFTSGKLKGMFENIKSVGTRLVDFLQVHADNNEVIEIREIASRYVADSLALIAFGVGNVNSIDNPKDEFRMKAIQLNSNASLTDIIRRSAVFVCPNLIKLLRLKGLPKFMRKFTLGLVKNTIQHREAHNTVQKDLMQYLIQLRNNSKGDLDDWSIKSTAKGIKSLSYEEIAGNVFLFYIAGSDSSSSAIAYTLYELTQNETIMERAKMDIRETLEKHDGKITYESVMEMKFIDLCVKETLRKYPALPILNRECTRDYKVPDMNFTIEKGTSVIISLLGISRDEKIFPNAEKYDPDRFTRDDFYEDMYMPFGAGPRNCIAFRMGLVVVKVAIVMMLMEFNFEAANFGELEFDYGTVSILPKAGQCIVKISKNEK